MSTQKAHKQVLVTLKTVESLSYNCADATKLLWLDSMLKDIETKLRTVLPHQDGLLLRPALITHTAKKVSKKYKKIHQRSLRYSSLSLHSKARQKKKDWHFRNRVGGKALRHKKVPITKYVYPHVYTKLYLLDFR